MPLVHTETIDKGCQLVVWKIEETEERLREILPETIDLRELNSISHPQKKREWLASRVVLVDLLNDRKSEFLGTWKDSHGKPYLIGNTAFISLTHTAEYVAVVLHAHAVGIDMERKSEKLVRVADKYLDEAEQTRAGTDLSILCTYWCAKEAMYKFNGRKKVSFRDHIRLDSAMSPLTGRLQDQGRTMDAVLHVRWFGEYCLVVAM